MSIPSALPLQDFFNNPNDFCQSDGQVFPQVLKLFLLNGGHASQMEEILKVFNDILSSGQQFSIPVKPNLGWTLLSLSESPNGLL